MLRLLSIIGRSSFTDILFWGVMVILFFLFLWFIFRQRKVGKKLKYELEQLDRIKGNNIESDFVLKAMKLTTWHLDPKTMKLTFDADFREKGTWVAPHVDGDSIIELGQQIHPQDAPFVDKALRDICEGRTEDYHMEYRVLIPHSDNCYWEESYATIVERDVEGKPTSIVGTTKRIDNRKQMEQALIEARNRAEESDRMKSAFIANMSHEIRTPLNAIVGFTSVLPDIEAEEERKALLDLVHENTQKLLHIIDDVVNISKIESGQEQTQLTSFELNQLLSEHADRSRQELKPGVGLLTAFARDGEPMMITTDYGRLSEIVRHLLSNAVKFTSQGSIVLGYDMPADGRIRIWVADTGKGIAEEHQERIFERFFKVDEFVPGAGLGLSLCRTMAYSLGGSVTVTSKLGEGSKFVVEIPIQ
jgi:signal transduction histidine kinase